MTKKKRKSREITLEPTPIFNDVKCIELGQEEETMTENSMTNMESKETLQNVESEQTVDEAFAQAVGLIPDELIEVADEKQFERSTETVSVKTIVNRYKKGNITIPACQRLYVWKQSDVDLLLDSINHNFPIGILMLGDCDGKKYLLDGLQRLTSIVASLNRTDLTKEQKNAILEYRIVVETIRGMDMDDMNAFIQRCNMGVKMSSATKHRAGLPSSLFDLVVGLAGKEAYRTLKTNRTFTTGAHNELIAMHSLLTAAKLFGGKNTASELCKRMKAGEDLVLQNQHIAEKMIDFVINAFVDMPRFLKDDKHYMERDVQDTADHLSVKGLNTNFVSAVFRILMKHPEMTQRELQEMILHIFEGTKAIKEYSATTARNASDERNMSNRLVFLEGLLQETREKLKDIDTSNAWSLEEDKPEQTEEPQQEDAVDDEIELVDAEVVEDTNPQTTQESEIVDIDAEAPDAAQESSDKYTTGDLIELEQYPYSRFCEDYDKETLTTVDGVVSVAFKELTEEEKRQVYMAKINHDDEMIDRVVAKRAAIFELTQE